MAHLHPIRDVDPNFVIDAGSRTINDQSPNGTSMMQYDHNSELLTFEIPLKIEDHTMTDCDQVQIHFINIGPNGQKNPGVYPVEKLALKDTDSEVVVFSWLVSQEATKYAGSLSFAIRFACTGNENTKEYVWNTAICNTITIGPGMDNGEVIVTQYADILAAWYNEFMTAGENGVIMINEAKEKALEDIAKESASVIANIASEEVVPMLEEEIEDEKHAAIETIHVQADEIVNLVLSRLPKAEEASF